MRVADRQPDPNPRFAPPSPPATDTSCQVQGMSCAPASSRGGLVPPQAPSPLIRSVLLSGGRSARGPLRRWMALVGAWPEDGKLPRACSSSVGRVVGFARETRGMGGGSLRTAVPAAAQNGDFARQCKEIEAHLICPGECKVAVPAKSVLGGESGLCCSRRAKRKDCCWVRLACSDGLWLWPRWLPSVVL